MNNKRRLINEMVMGCGIVCGLSVISLDDLSLMIESGMAIDDGGREIVVDSSIVKKLSTIDGFESLTSSYVSLCIRYREQETQPVYAVNHQEGEKEYEYNRIEESYELFVQDCGNLPGGFAAESEFFTGGVLFENPDYCVSLYLPANVCTGHYAKLTLAVEKRSDADVGLCFGAVLQTPLMTSLEGAQELDLSLENISLACGQKLTKEYWMLVQKEAMSDSSVILKSGSARASVGGVDIPAVSGFTCKVNAIDDQPELLAAREAGKMSFELRGMGMARGFVELARLRLVRTETAYIIECVEEDGVKTYVPTLRDAALREEFARYFGRRLPFYGTAQSSGAAREADVPQAPGMKGFRIETGVVEIPLGDHAKRGDICYSGEIMHGLGKGNVYVQVGLERMEHDAALDRESKTTVYGNPDLFDTNGAVVSAETAVKVLGDKGSFIVAVRLMQDVDYLLLTYRWIAIRVSGEEPEELPDTVENDRGISAVTPTVVLGTKETYYFQVKYNNMKPCSVSYEMTEPGSGEVTADGIYTAPAKEGVYEIRIYCTDRPLMCTYAYAIVKKKTSEEQVTE